MERPQPPEKPKHFWLVLLMACGVLLATIGILSFLTLGFMYPVVIGIGCLFAMVLFHYLVWGWWLGPMIRAEEAEDRDEK